jgi:hypothetical protein
MHLMINGEKLAELADAYGDGGLDRRQGTHAGASGSQRSGTP